MGKPLSMDLRERIIDYVTSGQSSRQAARVYNVAPSTVVRLVAVYRETGNIAPKPQGRPPGKFGKTAKHWEFVLEVVQCEPDITLHEMASALLDAEGETLSISSLHNFLQREGYRYKKRPDRRGAQTRGRRTRPPGLEGGPSAAHALSAVPTGVH